MITDKEWKESIQLIDDPIIMLQTILDHLDYFGDPYYSDLGSCLIHQITQVIKNNNKKEKMLIKCAQFYAEGSPTSFAAHTLQTLGLH